MKQTMRIFRSVHLFYDWSFLLAAVVLIAGCRQTSSNLNRLPGQSDPPPISKKTALSAKAPRRSRPAPASSSLSITLPSSASIPPPAGAGHDYYLLGPQDILRLTVYAHDLKVLDVKARVSSRGTITLPLLGELPAGGVTLKNLENRITAALNRDFFVNPRVLLDIDQFRERKVFVLGQVNQPGEYDITGPKIMTAVQAISLAGGLTKGAALNGTRITRMEDGQEKVLRIKLKDIIEDGKKKLDVIVRDRDILFVPERFF